MQYPYIRPVRTGRLYGPYARAVCMVLRIGLNSSIKRRFWLSWCMWFDGLLLAAAVFGGEGVMPPNIFL